MKNPEIPNFPLENGKARVLLVLYVYLPSPWRRCFPPHPDGVRVLTYALTVIKPMIVETGESV